MTTTNADDVTNEPTGDTLGASKPTTTNADWVPETSGGSDTVEAKTVEAPPKTTARKQSQASKK